MEQNKKDKKIKKENIKSTKGFAELKEQIKKLRRELFDLKLEQAQRKLKNTSSLTRKRKEIAQLLTSLRIMELTR